MAVAQIQWSAAGIIFPLHVWYQTLLPSLSLGNSFYSGYILSIVGICGEIHKDVQGSEYIFYQIIISFSRRRRFGNPIPGAPKCRVPGPQLLLKRVGFRV